MDKNKKKTNITFWGGVGAVTGANFLLETHGKKILIDCGMVQGLKEEEDLNSANFPYNPSEIDFLLITHAHIDHIGRVPKLFKDGFRGRIISTPETKQIARIMLLDAVSIIAGKARNEGKRASFEDTDVKGALSIWDTVLYHKEMSLCDGVEIYLWDAGHILGSAMIELRIRDSQNKKRKILFTGDLGNSPSPLLPDTEIPADIEFLIMDSVYGDRNHESTEDRRSRFLNVIKDVLMKRGVLLIPSFSLERTQTILFEIDNFIEKKLIDPVPVFLDSPLAIRLTEIYESISHLYNEGVKKEIRSGDKIFEFPKLVKTAKVEDSKKIASSPNPKIIIAGSGMSTAGRILHHEKDFLPDKNSTILLMGYQAPGTIGRELQDGAKKIVIDGEEIFVRAKVEVIDGYSGHKDSDNLLEFVASLGAMLRKIFVVMGEPKSSLFLSQRIHDYVGIPAIYPERGKPYFLF